MGTSTGTSRRQFIGFGAAALAAGTVCRGVSVAAPEQLEAEGLELVSVAAVGNGHVGLARTASGAPVVLRRLSPGADGSLHVVGDVGPPLPDDVVPVVVAAVPGEGVLVGGGRPVVVDEVPTLTGRAGSGADGAAGLHGPDGAGSGGDAGGHDEVVATVYGESAVLLHVTADTVREIELPPEVTGPSFSVVEGMIPDGRDIVALVGHNGDDPEAHHVSRLAVLQVAGREVAGRADVGRDMGESGPNFLLAASDADPGPEILVNGGDGSHSRLAPDGRGGARRVAAPRPGRVVTALDRGCLVEDPATGAVRWVSARGHPAPPVVEEQLAAGERPEVLRIVGESDRVVALVDGQLRFVAV